MATVWGYPSSTSVPAGGEISFHLAAQDGIPEDRDLVVDRVWPTAGPATQEIMTVPVPVQPVPASAAWEGYGWDPVHTFAVPDDWPSGLYRLQEAGETLFDFLVTSANPGATSSILFQVCTHTPQAYWEQGGRSFYTVPRAPRLSYDRPGAQYRQAEPFLAWLESEGIEVEFCASHDLESDQTLAPYDLVLIVGHDEYWTAKMRSVIDVFVARGGNVAVFSGNTCYRQIRIEGDRADMMSCYKDPADDPESDRDRLSVAMSFPPLCTPTASTLGAGFSHGAGCWNDTGLMAGEALSVRFPDHWVFAGVTSSRVGVGHVGYETDAVAYVDEPEGYPRVTTEDGALATTTVLATADLRHWAGGGKAGMATAGIQVRNGTVFTLGSVGWQEGLGGDADVRQVTRNVVTRLAQRRTWTAWEQIGHANEVTAMTAVQNVLWCTTSDNRLWRRYPVGANAPWAPIGPADNVVAMAGAAGQLWAADTANRLWRRAPVAAGATWTQAGTGPAGGTRALAGTPFFLYALDAAGALWMAAARAPTAWIPVPAMTGVTEPSIRTFTAYEDTLFAATADGRLLRTAPDMVAESKSWTHVHHCNQATALATVDTMLFVTTTQNELWWLDLRGLPKHA